MLGTDTGELLIVEGTELKATLQLDLGSTVHSIASYAKVTCCPRQNCKTRGKIASAGGSRVCSALHGCL